MMCPFVTTNPTMAFDLPSLSDMDVIIIAAVAANGTIGNEGELPWYYPDDLKHFKETTWGHPVIMGRITFESILQRLGRPLPGRDQVVLTSNPDSITAALREASVEEEDRERVTPVSSVPDALAVARNIGSEHVFVAGGASVYEQLIHHADKMIITKIHDEYTGETTFPPVDCAEWVETDRDDRDEFSWVEYERSTFRERI